MRWILATALLAVGCGADRKAEAERRAAEKQELTAAAVAAAKAKAQAVDKDRPALVARAIADMRRLGKNEFGDSAAAAAVITADESGIKVQNEKKWDVNGVYAGADKNGKRFTAPFTVTLEIIGGKLNTNVAELKKRTYGEGP
jgi:hypothetical protein